MGKELATQIQKVWSPVQDKPKENHTQAHTNQTVKTEYKEKY